MATQIPLLSLTPLTTPMLPAADRSYQKLAVQIMALIDQGEFTPGARLPSERALAERFEVSRTSVREAIIALEFAAGGHGRNGGNANLR